VPGTSADPAFATTAAALTAPGRNVPRSAASFLAMMAGLAVIKVLLMRWVPTAFASAAQAQVFSWTWIGGLTVVGLVGVWFAARTGFPETWDPAVPLRDRVLLPVLSGIILGSIALVTDALTHWTAIVAEKMKVHSIHIGFPASLFVYPGAAVIVNTLYYLVPIPLFMWLLSLVTGGRWSTRIFWTVGILAALIEPLTQNLAGVVGAGLTAALFAEDFALNLVQVITFRRAGFGASVIVRVVYYLIWHALWGAIRG